MSFFQPFLQALCLNGIIWVGWTNWYHFTFNLPSMNWTLFSIFLSCTKSRCNTTGTVYDMQPPSSRLVPRHLLPICLALHFCPYTFPLWSKSGHANIRARQHLGTQNRIWAHRPSFTDTKLLFIHAFLSTHFLLHTFTLSSLDNPAVHFSAYIFVVSHFCRHTFVVLHFSSLQLPSAFVATSFSPQTFVPTPWHSLFYTFLPPKWRSKFFRF